MNIQIVSCQDFKEILIFEPRKVKGVSFSLLESEKLQYNVPWFNAFIQEAFITIFFYLYNVSDNTIYIYVNCHMGLLLPEVKMNKLVYKKYLVSEKNLRETFFSLKIIWMK